MPSVNDPSSDQARCFVGLALDAKIGALFRERVESVLDRDDWKCHEREDYHLTLCFLGEIPTGRVPSLRAALAETLRGLAAPRLHIRGVGTFGGETAPRVLWAAVEASDVERAKLVALREACAAAIARSGLTFDQASPFTPHVTLARPRRRVALPRAFAEMALQADWRPTHVTLFGSVPGARPHYPALESFPLA